MVHNLVINVEPAWVWANEEHQQTVNEEKNGQQMKLQPVLVMVPVQEGDETSHSVLKVIQEQPKDDSNVQNESQWVLQEDEQWELQEPEQETEQWQLHIEQEQWEQQEQDTSQTWYLQQDSLVQQQAQGELEPDLLIVTGQVDSAGETLITEPEKEVVFSVQNPEEASSSTTVGETSPMDHDSKACECVKCRKPPGPSYQHMFNCDVCGKPFSQKKWLTLHRKTHKKKVYRCTICNKRFTCRSDCNVHVRLHKGKKPLECYVCGKWFSFNKQLKEHLKLHETGKTFQCNVCSNTFSSLSELNDHFKEHSTDAPSKCHKCEKEFICKKTFALHLISHNKEETSFECVLCGNLFPQASSLAHHLRTHSECYVCGQVFSFSNDLIEHLREHVDIDGQV